jgi:membrane protein DedA with SNARE-associated domain
MWGFIQLMSQTAVNEISKWGYWGVGLGMAIESACIPLPSEIILPFTGFLVWQGKLNLWLATLVSALGCLGGSLAAYLVGYVGGRPFIQKYGRYFFVSAQKFARTEKWFLDHGDATIFFSRLLPVVRTFISLPAGIAGMNLKKFMIYTFLGSLPWSLVFIYLGTKLGQHWNSLQPLFHKLDLLIAIALAVGFLYWCWKLKSSKATS